jgi:predicted TIM-barrel fold metal-dependent hydrolase
MLIDAHTHAFLPEDLEVLSQRMEDMDSGLPDHDPNKWQLYGRGDVNTLIGQMESAGVDKFVLLPVSGRKERVAELNRWAAAAAGQHPGLIPFGILHPQGEVEKELALLMELGLKGIKLHPFVQRFSLGTPESDHLFGLAAEAGLPILADTLFIKGLLKAKPHLDWLVESYNSDDSTPEHLARLARAYPRLRIIAAHLGCLYGWEHIDPLMELDNVFLDISWVNGILSPEQVVSLIRRKGPDKVIYGSDAPWRDALKFRRWFEDLSLSPGEKDQIAAGTIMPLIS